MHPGPSVYSWCTDSRAWQSSEACMKSWRDTGSPQFMLMLWTVFIACHIITWVKRLDKGQERLQGLLRPLPNLEVMANYFNFCCGLAYVQGAHINVCGIGLIYEGSYFSSSKTWFLPPHPLRLCLCLCSMCFTAIVCWIIWWWIEWPSSLPSSGIGYGPALGTTPSFHLVSPEVQWPDGAGEPDTGAVSLLFY